MSARLALHASPRRLCICDGCRSARVAQATLDYRAPRRQLRPRLPPIRSSARSRRCRWIARAPRWRCSKESGRGDRPHLRLHHRAPHRDRAHDRAGGAAGERARHAAARQRSAAARRRAPRRRAGAPRARAAAPAVADPRRGSRAPRARSRGRARRKASSPRRPPTPRAPKPRRPGAWPTRRPRRPRSRARKPSLRAAARRAAAERHRAEARMTLADSAFVRGQVDAGAMPAPRGSAAWSTSSTRRRAHASISKRPRRRPRARDRTRADDARCAGLGRRLGEPDRGGRVERERRSGQVEIRLEGAD